MSQSTARATALIIEMPTFYIYILYIFYINGYAMHMCRMGIFKRFSFFFFINFILEKSLKAEIIAGVARFRRRTQSYPP